MIKITPFGDREKKRRKESAERGGTKRRGLLSAGHMSEGIRQEWSWEVGMAATVRNRDAGERIMGRNGVLQHGCTYVQRVQDMVATPYGAATVSCLSLTKPIWWQSSLCSISICVIVFSLILFTQVNRTENIVQHQEMKNKAGRVNVTCISRFSHYRYLCFCQSFIRKCFFF